VAHRVFLSYAPSGGFDGVSRAVRRRRETDALGHRNRQMAKPSDKNVPALVEVERLRDEE
jgi:hypothetical protein